MLRFFGYTMFQLRWLITSLGSFKAQVFSPQLARPYSNAFFENQFLCTTTAASQHLENHRHTFLELIQVNLTLMALWNPWSWKKANVVLCGLVFIGRCTLPRDKPTCHILLQKNCKNEPLICSSLKSPTKVTSTHFKQNVNGYVLQTRCRKNYVRIPKGVETSHLSH